MEHLKLKRLLRVGDRFYFGKTAIARVGNADGTPCEIIRVFCRNGIVYYEFYDLSRVGLSYIRNGHPAMKLSANIADIDVARTNALLPIESNEFIISQPSLPKL